jgi:translation elongation factor EF-Ts
LQSNVQLKGFLRVSLGEGVEKPETDFAAEVNAQIR